jgi:hypothetical protein
MGALMLVVGFASILAGAALALFFRVLVLILATAVVLGALGATAFVRDVGVIQVALELLATAAALQLGYFAPAVLQN